MTNIFLMLSPHPARRDGERDGELMWDKRSSESDPIRLEPMVKQMRRCDWRDDRIICFTIQTSSLVSTQFSPRYFGESGRTMGAERWKKGVGV